MLMYIDIKKYRLSNENLRVWYKENDEHRITLVLMKYHTSFSIFSDEEELDVFSITTMINDYHPNSISSTKDIIETLQRNGVESYDYYFGYIIKYTNIRDYGGADYIEKAKDQDLREIAELILSDDDIGSYYEIADFEQQLRERMQSGMGRNYIARENGKIIGHVGTYAEFENISVGGGLIVKASTPKKMLGTVLENYIAGIMRDEGFAYYGFVSERRKNILTLLGHTCVAEYGKMTLIK